ncbi:tyrosine-type recombinase/integrase [uncultured Thiodictyon sp.]|uniref:tyrosine-type recombinase/integrase n=1 Tax=uncultured Thiodictyon sp. TaxID=1846217 RepID=UPI0025F965E1|nr:tyrosine-type recombinase/integrase [uncultured Thiodictyon sp.]
MTMTRQGIKSLVKMTRPGTKSPAMTMRPGAKARKRDQDGLFQRPDSPYWWASTPDGLGGSTRRSTGVRVDADPNGLKIASVKVGFASCVKTAGLVDVHPHDLRRSFGSWLVQGGVGIERVSDLLRHGDVAITARVYAHLRPSDLAEAVAVLDRAGSTVSRSGFTFGNSSMNRN